MTKSTAVVYHKDYLKHFPSDSCPDRMARLVETLKLFISEGLLKSIEVRTPTPATEDDLLRVHKKKYVEEVKDLSLFGGGALDADTEVKPKTFELAKLAAGGARLAGEYVIRGMYKNAFALVRPPGNHATKSAGMEYCYFNNAAVMIEYLKVKYKLKKILILSWSAHAANGTMDIFYNDKSVLDISIHQDPHTIFPNTGFIDQTGEGDGEGYTVNIPVPEGTSDADYVYILEKFILPLTESFKPELIVISAGQDAHNDDVTSDLCLTEACYGVMTSLMKNAAEKICGGKLVVVLEGGYEPASLARSNLEIVNSLIGESKAQVTGTPKEETIAIVNELKEKFSKYHKLETNGSNLP